MRGSTRESLDSFTRLLESMGKLVGEIPKNATPAEALNATDKQSLEVASSLMGISARLLQSVLDRK